jgi:predicted ATP-dependent endonuclease of OLD family
MIERLYIQNFRCLESITLDFAGRPSALLIGKNGAGVLRNLLGQAFEQIGKSLADDCHAGTETVWGHEHLGHNDNDLARLVAIVEPILFGT